MATLFYELPARHVQPGATTDDGQDVLAVRVDDGLVSVSVYTPRPDDPEADAYNLSTPETRIYDLDRLVGLAVFDDTATDLSTHPAARNVNRR